MRLLISESNRWHWAVGIHLFILALYLTTNHIQLYDPFLLETNWIDEQVPFIPLSLWIYLSFVVSFMSVFIWERDIVHLNRFAYAFLAVNIAANIVFCLFPTRYDRSAALLPSGIDELTALGFTFLHIVDTPANCLPSLHVSNVFLASFAWFRRFAVRYYVYLVWAILVSFSTLTTKQHYFVDVVVGFLFAFLGYRCFYATSCRRMELAHSRHSAS